MKKPLFVAAALGALASPAFAQTSSVTVFGVIDVGVRYTKNDTQTLWTESTSGIRSSRFGVRGVEQLGGTLSAQFHLESAVNADAGTADASKFWSRRSTLSLVSTDLGEVRLGRDLLPTWTGFADYDVFTTNGVADAGKFDSVLGSGALTVVRADNMVAYLTPNLGGPFVRVAFAPGEGTGGNKYAGAQVGYNNGPIDVSVSYGESNDLANVEKWKKGSVGLNYNFGPVVLQSYVTQNRYIDQKLNIYQVGARVPFGLHTVRANFTKADGKGRTAGGVSIDADDATQVAVGYIYDLSKRSALYGTVARVDNKGNAKYLVQSTPATPAGRKSTGIEFGLRHGF
jgi:predicted porin